MNLYAYCAGDPVGLVDPSGLDPFDVENASEEEIGGGGPMLAGAACSVYRAGSPMGRGPNLWQRFAGWLAGLFRPNKHIGSAVALGKSGGLRTFSRATGGLTYETWVKGAHTLGEFHERFDSAMRSAKVIYVNLDGVDMNIVRYHRQQPGKLPYYGPHGGSVTEWEIAKILMDRRLHGRTRYTGTPARP